MPLWTRNLSSQDQISTVSDLYVNAYNDFIYVCGGSNFCGTNNRSGISAVGISSDNQRLWRTWTCSLSTSAYGSSIIADNSQNSYISGNYQQYLTPGDTVLWKLNSTGGQTWFNKFVNTEGDILTYDLAFNWRMDSFDAVGTFWDSVDFDPSGGLIHRSSYGNSDGFLTKWNQSGTNLMVKTWGDSSGSGVADVSANTVAVDDSGNIFVAGEFTDTVDFDPSRTGQNRSSSSGSRDIFVAKFDSSGNYISVIRIGNADDEAVDSIAIDSNNDIYITGYFEGTVDFNPNQYWAFRTAVGFIDCYLAKYNNDLGYIWARSWGSFNQDQGRAVAISPINDFVLLVGVFSGTVDFDPGPGVFELSTGSAAERDSFLMKLFPNGFWAP